MGNTNSTKLPADSSDPDQVASGSFPSTPELPEKAKVAPWENPPITPGLPQSPPGPGAQAWNAWSTPSGPYYQVPTNNAEDYWSEHWKELYEKADQFDKEFYNGWISEIDSIPTFAGLLAGVVTAFTIESYKLLRPDPQQITNHTLLNISAQLAGGNATALPSFAPSSSSLRINILWFLSLTCILMAGLVAVLSKQWLRQYRRRDFSLPYKEALALRQLRLEGILRWKVTGILSALPILLALGLILFFVGLIDFLHGLGVGLVSIPVTALIGVGFVFLAVTTTAPAFQYIIAHYSRHSREPFRPALFAFKSPQSLAILHLATWLFPLPGNFNKLPNWASWEFAFFSSDVTVQTYAKHALAWIHETYSHSLDMVYQICLCLQDVEDQALEIESVGRPKPMLQNFAREESRSATIKPLFDTIRSASGADQTENHGIVALKYLSSSEALAAMSFDQILTILNRSMRALDRSHRQTPSFDAFRSVFVRLSTQVPKHFASYGPGAPGLSPFQQVVRKRAILFQKLLLEKRWTDSTGIPMEVRHVSENFGIFSNGDLHSIFSAVRVWISQHPQDTSLPSHCWTSLISQVRPHQLENVLGKPPVRDFMDYLDSRLQMGDSIEYLCRPGFWYYREEEFRSFFTALDAWIRRNPQDVQSFAKCQTLLMAMDHQNLERVRHHRAFRDFEAFLRDVKPIWQRATHFRDLLLKGQWEEVPRIPEEVWNIFVNLKIFSDEDLNSIFNALRGWIDQHPQDGPDLPSHCWTILTCRSKPHELKEVLQYRPPVRDFMAFLDSRFEMGIGVNYMCSRWYYRKEQFDSFFTALRAWVEKHPQGLGSFVRCQTLVTTLGGVILGNARQYPSFRNFEVSVEAALSRGLRADYLR